MCASLCAPPVPRHSWLGCLVWVCVLWLRSRLRPVTPGWGVGVLCVLVCALRWYPATPGWALPCGLVCVGSGFGWAPPLLSAVLGCACLCALRLYPATPGWGVRAWARVSAAPRHSWLGCWGLCVFVCPLRLYPATPGWGVRCGCVCFGSGFGCAPPLLAGVLGCACLCARSACTPPLLAGVCGVRVCASARVSAAPRHSWLGCWGVCVLVCALRLYPATPGWGVWCGGVCLGLGFGCAPPLLAGVFGCACLCACSALYPATPGLGVRCGRVCLGSGFVGAPPLLAGVSGVDVCAWARVLAAPRHSWLGCWCVFVLVCGLRLYPATPGLGVWCGCVCLGSSFGCAPPLLAGVCGVGVCAWALVSAAPRHSWLGCWGSVCACVRAPLVPRHSWLGCAPCACVLGLGLWLGPASPGWGVGVCVFVCPLGLYRATPGWGVRSWAQVLAAPRYSWLGCWRLCVFVCALRLYPATPSWGVLRGHVCFGSGFGFPPPLLAGVLGCACLCAGSACAAPLLAGLCGVGACAWARVLVAPRHSWLGCAVRVSVLELGFRLRPATPGLGVGVCVCLCVRSA